MLMFTELQSLNLVDRIQVVHFESFLYDVSSGTIFLIKIEEGIHDISVISIHSVIYTCFYGQTVIVFPLGVYADQSNSILI